MTEAKISQRTFNEAIHLMSTVAAPMVSIESESSNASLMNAVLIDPEEQFIRKSEIRSLRQSFHRAFSLLEPEEAAAVQTVFGLDLVDVPHHVVVSADPLRNTILIASALDKLRKIPHIQKLQPAKEAKVIQSVKTEAVQTEDDRSGPAREIPSGTIEKVRKIKEQRQGKHGGLNNAQICKTLGITREELNLILSLPKAEQQIK